MTTYLITFRDESETTMTVLAESYEQAASKAARAFYAKRELVARRVTGFPGMSGYFQGYRPVPHGGLSSAGRGFHVRELVTRRHER